MDFLSAPLCVGSCYLNLTSISQGTLPAEINYRTFLMVLHNKGLLYTHSHIWLGSVWGLSSNVLQKPAPSVVCLCRHLIPFPASSASAWQSKKKVSSERCRKTGRLLSRVEGAHSTSACTHWPELGHMATANCKTSWKMFLCVKGKKNASGLVYTYHYFCHIGSPYYHFDGTLSSADA